MFLGDLSYTSYYRAGVAQAASLLGAWHRDVDLRSGDAALIDRQVREAAPDLIWTHMLLWPPPGALPLYEIVGLAERWRQGGAIVLLHDGDPRPAPRFPYDVSACVDLALLNHAFDRSVWGVPTLHWPYAAMTQDRLADPHLDYRADLMFGGLLRSNDGDLYDERTACLHRLVARCGLRAFPAPGEANTRLRTPEVAASCIAVLGFGRPEVPGWIDTRVLQYPGAGAILLHDDVHPEFTSHVD